MAENLYRAEYGAIHREGLTGFLFIVSPPEFAEDVADALNKALTRPQPSQPSWRPDREAVARIIDPSKWRVLDSYLADVKRKYRGKDAAYDPEAFKDKESLAKADAILALPTEEGEALGELLDRSTCEHGIWIGATCSECGGKAQHIQPPAEDRGDAK